MKNKNTFGNSKPVFIKNNWDAIKYLILLPAMVGIYLGCMYVLLLNV